MKINLCSGSGSCPSVKVTEQGAEIGEGNEKIKLSKNEWNVLVDEIKDSSLKRI